MNAKEKNRLAGIFLLAHGGLTGLLYLIAAIFVAVIIGSDRGAPPIIFGIALFAMTISFAIFCLPQLIGGWKMYKESPDAKNWGIAAAIVSCLSGFLGIVSGVFALIFLLGEDGKSFYRSIKSGNYLNPVDQIDDFDYLKYSGQQPREPHSWR